MEHQLYPRIDVDKTEHHATGVGVESTVLYDKPLPQSEPKIRVLLQDLATAHGRLLVVVDQHKNVLKRPRYRFRSSNQ